MSDVQVNNDDVKLLELSRLYCKEHCKFYGKGNQQAGTRARKLLLDIHRLTKQMRLDISTVKALKTVGGK